MKLKEVLLFGFIFFAGLVLAITGYVSESGTTSSVKVGGLDIRYVTYDGVTTDFNTFNTSTLNNLPGAILENSTREEIEKTLLLLADESLIGSILKNLTKKMNLEL